MSASYDRMLMVDSLAMEIVVTDLRQLEAARPPKVHSADRHLLSPAFAAQIDQCYTAPSTESSDLALRADFGTVQWAVIKAGPSISIEHPAHGYNIRPT